MSRLLSLLSQFPSLSTSAHLSLLGVLFLACGSDPNITTDPSGGDGSGGRKGEPKPPGVELPTDPSEDCESGILCGVSSQCCASGQECVSGACENACETGTRCNGECCPGADQVCLEQTCVDPGAACLDSFDCDEHEFCEPTLMRCLPQPQEGEPACTVRGEILPFNPQIKWEWPADEAGAVVHPNFTDITSLPVVLDVDGDEIPDVFVLTHEKNVNEYEPSTSAYLRRLNGKTGEEVWEETADVYKEEYQVNLRSSAALGDLEGDGRIEIVAGKRGGGLIAFDAETGAFKWQTRRRVDDSKPCRLPGEEGYEAAEYTNYNPGIKSGAVAIADLDFDGEAEVIVGGLIFDSRGCLVKNSMSTDKRGGQDRRLWGSNSSGTSYYGAVSIVAPVTLDAEEQVILTGNGAYYKDGSALWEDLSLTDGYTAIADLDFPPDGIPELVVISRGKARVQNAQTGALLAEYDFTLPEQDRGTNRGGPPTIADFNGDGRLEFASAGGYSYNVFEFRREPDGSNPRIELNWSRATQDTSSNVTGSSVFDFEGDGRAEVVYGDECFTRVYDGVEGNVLFEVPNSSATIHEYPVLVDVDGDNRSEFLIVGNTGHHYDKPDKCSAYAEMDPPPALRSGIVAYGDANNRWMRTRRLWNQHAYNQVNINNDGSIPSEILASWSAGRNNDYRLSSQGSIKYNAPDLAVDLEISTASCPDGLTLRARVRNEGSLGVLPGVSVEFFDQEEPGESPLATATTTRPLLPGQSEVVSFFYEGKKFQFSVRVNGEKGATGSVLECLDTNNNSQAGGKCPTVR